MVMRRGRNEDSAGVQESGIPKVFELNPWLLIAVVPKIYLVVVVSMFGLDLYILYLAVAIFIPAIL
jgi:hypothetical protein